MKYPVQILCVISMVFSLQAFAAQQEDGLDDKNAISETYEQEAFITRVNEAWVSSNYFALENVMNSQLEENPDDLLALGLRYIYYFMVVGDFMEARGAAQDYITAVSNRMPSEVINRRVPVNIAMSIIEMPIPSDLPAARTHAEMNKLHRHYRRSFPMLDAFRLVPARIEKLEAGIITDEDLIAFDEASILEATDNFGLPSSPE